jgi:hypothetical protein
MTLSRFLSLLVRHGAYALAVWCVCALAAEYLIPGFVTPFVNLPMVVFTSILLLTAALILPNEPSV